MICQEHLELVHDGAKGKALGSSKTCAQVFEGHSGVCLRYLGDGKMKLQWYLDSNWESSAIGTLRCCFSVGSMMNDDNLVQ